MDRAKLDALIVVVDSKIASEGFECVEAEWMGNTKTLRIFVERTGVGMNIEGCVQVNALLNEYAPLDQMVSGSYQLEVSSPGIERPLRKKEHFQKHLGEMVQVKLLDKQMERRSGTGRIKSVGETVALETDQGVWEFDFSKLQKAQLVFDWERQNDNRKDFGKD